MATPLVGQQIRASDAVGANGAAASGAISPVTTVAQDVPGATVTIATAAGAEVLVVGVWDISATGATDVFAGSLVVDGVSQTGVALSAVTGRHTIAQTWTVTFASAGSHTLKLQAVKSGAANTLSVQATHTKISVVGAAT